LTYDDFSKIFCKGIFKNALVNITSEIDSNSTKKEDLPLTVKINEF
jgi:hypothetical protein